MSSIERPLSGVLTFDLAQERGQAIAITPLERGARTARTLIKSGSLRVTLIVLAPGGELAEHQAPGPITVQPIEGSIRFSVEGVDHDLGTGQLLTVGGGVRHTVTSEHGGAFLLTIAAPGS